MAQRKHWVQANAVQVRFAADAVKKQILLVILAQDLFIDLLVQFFGGQIRPVVFFLLFSLLQPEKPLDSAPA